MRWFLAILVAALLAAGVFVMQQHRCLDAPASGNGESVVTIARGQSLADVRRTLTDEGLLACPTAWYWYARYRGLDRQLKAGEFSLNRQLSGYQLLDRLVDGAVVTHSITFIEGWTAAEAVAAIRGHDAIRQTMPADADAAAWLTAIDAAEEHWEGLFFPSTYHFERGTSDVEVLARAYREMQRVLGDVWANRVEGLPLDSPYDALILASIIEKETARDDERRDIAGVFVRRLRKGMRLQTDPTVIYGMGAAYDGNIRRRDLTTDTPYNTYTRKGLTPTPIALPGRGSLAAAVDPADGETLFFVATGLADGSHTFSVTEAEHNAAVKVYLERLRSGASQP
ncbi:MAG: endolytic transglycosylase MltG [Pseudomonadota bacterium]